MNARLFQKIEGRGERWSVVILELRMVAIHSFSESSLRHLNLERSYTFQEDLPRVSLGDLAAPRGEEHDRLSGGRGAGGKGERPDGFQRAGGVALRFDPYGNDVS